MLPFVFALLCFVLPEVLWWALAADPIDEKPLTVDRFVLLLLLAGTAVAVAAAAAAAGVLDTAAPPEPDKDDGMVPLLLPPLI